jgi:dolichyl-phosphate beta-glucosyltransferase
MKSVSLVIPAYNEVARIRETVAEAVEYFSHRGQPFEIIVSADGTDGTREAVMEMAATRPELRVIGSSTRRGKGIGIREGVRIARGAYIGFSDADNKTPITEFDKIEPQLESGVEVVIGSRGARGARIEQAQPLYRRLGSRAFGFVMHTCVGLGDIVDTQCGFKFMRGDVAKDLFARQQIDGYMFDVEVLYLARLLGYRISQVPIRWRDDGDSRLSLVMGNLRNGRDLLSVRWRHRALARPRVRRRKPRRRRKSMPESPGTFHPADCAVQRPSNGGDASAGSISRTASSPSGVAATATCVSSIRSPALRFTTRRTTRVAASIRW